MFLKKNKNKKQLNSKDRGRKSHKHSQKLIGLEVVKNVIRMVVIQGQEISYGEQLLEGTIIKRDKLRNTEELAAAMRALAKELGASGGKVVYHLNNQTVLIQELDHIKDKSEQQIKDGLFLELGDTISLPFSTPKFELLLEDASKSVKKVSKRSSRKSEDEMDEVESPAETSESLKYIVTSEEFLIELGDCLIQAGLKPAAVDFSAVAYTRYFEQDINCDEIFLLVELSSGVATMTIFENSVPIYVQYEDYNGVGWRYFNDEEKITYFFNADKEAVEFKKLVMVIEQLTYYYQTSLSDNQEISRIYVTGEHPWIATEQIASLMIQTLQVPISLLKVSSYFPAKYLLSVGLAMKEGQ